MLPDVSYSSVKLVNTQSTTESEDASVFDIEYLTKHKVKLFYYNINKLISNFLSLICRYNFLMILYFTRHGESEWNLAHRIQGRHDSPLTERGVRMAQQLKKRLAGVSYSRCYVSPLERAVQTARILTEGTGITPEPEERIGEVNLGEVEGLIMEELPPEELHAFYHDPENFHPRGHEGYDNALHRVSDFMRTLETEEGSVLLVSHALILRLIRLYLLDLPLSEMMKVYTPGCCCCEAHYSAGHWDLKVFADDRCQSPDYDPERWAYFGSPVPVSTIPSDAILTPYSELAAAYAHAPTHVEVGLNGIVTHDGTADGLLYRVDLSDRSLSLVGPAPAMRIDGPAYL